MAGLERSTCEQTLSADGPDPGVAGVRRERLKVAALPHLPDLDGLRAIAVGLVFIGHTHTLPRFPASFGVTLFFVLSGFLITTLLRLERARTGGNSLRNFYIRRLLRINPPLYATLLLIGVLVALGINPQVPDALGVAAQALFFSNYMPDFGIRGGLQTPLWSLAVEEHFYLVFPSLFVLAMRRGTPARLALGCAFACLAVLAIRLFNVVVLGVVEANGFWTHTRIDSILFGCILALWSNPVLDERPAWRAGNRQAALAVIVILASFAPAPPVIREGMRYTLQSAALVVLFNWLLQGRAVVAPFLRNPLVQRLGLWSYSFYLLHYAVIGSLRHIMPGLPVAAFVALSFLITCGLCEAMLRLVERPAARLRRRFAA